MSPDPEPPKKDDPTKDPPKKTEPAKVTPPVEPDKTDTLEIKITGSDVDEEVAALLAKQQAEIDVLKADKVQVERDGIMAKIAAAKLDPKDYEKLPIEVLKGVIITLEDKNLAEKDKPKEPEKKKGAGHFDSSIGDKGEWVN